MRRRIAFYSRDPEAEPAPPKTVVMATDTFVVPDILFATGSASLNKSSAADLDSFANRLRQRGIDSVVVNGFTDSVGKPAANEKLSNGRAQAVADYLRSKVSSQLWQYLVWGFGAAKPVASNSTTEGRRRNRRVEIYVYRKSYY